MDLSTTPARSSANIVYGPMEPEKPKEREEEDEEKQDGSLLKDEGTLENDAEQASLQLSPMMLRTRRSLNYSDMVHNEQNDDLSSLSETVKSGRKSGSNMDKENKSSKGLPPQKDPEKPAGSSAKPAAYTKVMSCHYCTFKSVYPGNLRSHIQRHLTPGRAHCVCTKCGLNFLMRRHLDAHTCQPKGVLASAQSKSLVYFCRLCDFRSEMRCNVTKHLYRHRCATCNMYFQTIVRRQRHSPRCNKPASATDPRGQRLKNNRGELITFDRQAPSSLVEMKCMTCKLMFQAPEEYHAHKCKTKSKDIQHTVVKPKRTEKVKTEGYDADLMLYCCAYCEFSSPSALAMRSHKKHPKTDKPLPKTSELQARRVSFARQKEKQRKKPRMEGWDEEAMLYVCNMCSFATPTPVAMYNHKKFHEVTENSIDLSVDEDIGSEVQSEEDKQEEVFHCPTCDFTSTRLWDFEAHKGLHSGTRPFKCSKCNIGFTDKFHLNIHQMKLHGQVERDEKVHKKSEKTPHRQEKSVKTPTPQEAKKSAKTPNPQEEKKRTIIPISEEEKKSAKTPISQEKNQEPCPQPACTFTTKSALRMNQHIRLHFAGLGAILKSKEQSENQGDGSAPEEAQVDPADFGEGQGDSTSSPVKDRESCQTSSDSQPTPLPIGRSILKQRGEIASKKVTQEKMTRQPISTVPVVILKDQNCIIGSMTMQAASMNKNAVAKQGKEITQKEQVPQKKRKPTDDGTMESVKKTPKLAKSPSEPVKKVSVGVGSVSPKRSCMKQVRISIDPIDVTRPDPSCESPWVPIEQAPLSDPQLSPPVIQPGFVYRDGSVKVRKSSKASCLESTSAVEPDVEMATESEKEDNEKEGGTMEKDIENGDGTMENNIENEDGTMENNIENESGTMENNIENESGTMENNIENEDGTMENNIENEDGTMENNIENDSETMENNIENEDDTMGNSAEKEDGAMENNDATDEPEPQQDDTDVSSKPPQSPVAARTDEGSNGLIQQHQQYRSAWRRHGWSNRWGAPPTRQVQLVELTTTTTATAASTTAAEPNQPPSTPRDSGMHNNNLVVPVPVRTPAPCTIANPSNAVAVDRPSHSGQVSSACGAPAIGGGSLHRCSFCKIYFEDFRLFLHHLEMHQPENPWMCTYCWRNFNNVFAFIDHH